MTQLLIIVAYMTLLLVLGTLANRLFRGTSRDYMLASSTIGPVLLLMSLFGTTMTAFALVGSTGKAYTLGVGVYGMLASASGIVHSACFFLIGTQLWAVGQKHGYTTQIQYFRGRLDCDWIGLLLFPMLVGLVIPYLLIGVLGAGAVINGATQGRVVEKEDGQLAIENATFAEGTFPAFLEQGPHGFAGEGGSKGGLPKQLASLGVCLVVLVYVFFGGMRGTAWANTFQTTVFMVLGLATFITIANGLGSSGSFFENMREISQQVDQPHLTRARVPKPVYFSFLLIPLSVGMFPHVFQHWLTARSAKTFKLPIVAHPIFIMIVWLPCVLVGVWASTPAAGLPENISENAVLARMVSKVSGPVLAGLLTAGILAAIMSSLDSQFLCLGTMFTNDIVGHYGFHDHLEDRRTVLVARSFVVGIVAVTYALSLFPPANIFDLGIWCFSGFTGLFPLVLAAVYWRRLTAAGAVASIVTTAVTWGYLFWRSDFAHNARYAFPEPGTPSAEMAARVGIPPMMPVVTVFVLSSLALIVGSLITRPPNETTLAKFFPDRAKTP